MNFYCLMVAGVALTDQIRNQLVDAARTMILNGDRGYRIVSDDFVGEVQTDMKTVLLGSIAGLLFTAEIQSVKGHVEVSYLVRPQDVSRINPYEGVWVHQPTMPIPFNDSY